MLSRAGRRVSRHASSLRGASTEAISTATTSTVPPPPAERLRRPPQALTTRAPPLTPLARQQEPTLTDLAMSHLASTPPPLSSLHALNARLKLDLELPVLEQALVHPTFWETTPFPKGDTSPQTHFLTDAKLHNGPLAALGNSLLGTLAVELLLSTYPNLPTRASKAALTLYVGPKTLAGVATSWGVKGSRLEDELLKGEKRVRELSRRDRAYGHLVEGVGGARKPLNSARDNSAGMSLVRWNRRPVTPLSDAILVEDVLASVPRALVGALHQTHGFARARNFARSHILTPSVFAPSNLLPLLKFNSPTLVLTSLLASYNLPRAVHRLLKESGRLSAHPTFLSGVYSGDRKLGEGFGSSIKMSQWRASEDALRRFYLSREVGREAKGLPSDGWMGSGDSVFAGLDVGEAEVMEESRD